MGRFERIIQQYKKLKEKYPDKVLENVLSQKKLETAILTSAISEDINGRLHNHQHRVGRKKLEVFAAKLEEKAKEIQAANDFDEIYKIVNSIQVKRVGQLAKYDISLRIGFYRGLLPTKIYIHQGTKVGAELLLKKKINKRFIEREELIEPFISADIECWEIEDILCIFKGKMK